MDGNTARPGLGGVGVGVDGSESVDAAATWASTEAVLREGALCLLRTTDSDAAPPVLSQAETDLYRRAGQELPDRTAAAVAARHPGLPTAADGTTPVVVVRGAPEPAETGAVLAAVRDENDAGCAGALVVVGGRRAPGCLGPTIGRTTLTRPQHAHSPVELIPRLGLGHGSTP
ncbi:universal stress protein [Streptomyces sp. NPDC093105]|uniref:universal stress protein n=1 Tax=Streptomyces sp. NPDC093105 TaxID=3366029 RepID=UPI00382759E5